MRLLEGDVARRWTLTGLAEELHLAPGYLVRLFKAATGLPPMAYLAQLRAEHAAVLLLHSDEPVTCIGRAVGWPDQNYFARRFKAHYGLSATTYRERFAPGRRAPCRELTAGGSCQPCRTAVWWQKCTRSAPSACIRASEPCHAAKSAACPSGSRAGSAAGSSRYWRGVYAASPVSRSAEPSPARTTTDWWPKVWPRVVTTDTPGRISASPSSSSNDAFMKPSQSHRSGDPRCARASSARWT